MTDRDSWFSMAQLHQGIQQFNARQYYDCHDTLEAIWMEAPTAEKPFYQGILQIAVGLHHLGNLNWQGAVILLGEGVSRLYEFEPTHQQVNVSNLIDQALDWLAALQQLGPQKVQLLANGLSQGTPQSMEGKLAVSIANLEVALSVPQIQID